MLFIVLADLLARAGLTPEQLRWLYPVKIAAVSVLLVVFWGHYAELQQGWPSALAAAVAVLLGLVVWWLWIHLHADWMVLGQSDGYDPRVNGVPAWPLVMVRVAGAALVVPLMEELFWRSFLLRWLESPNFEQISPAMIKLKSFLVTVILFGVEHNLWLAGMVAGAVYSLLYMRTQNLWVAVLSHAVTNGVLGVWIIFTGSWSYW
jgi:hypothetical protein